MQNLSGLSDNSDNNASAMIQESSARRWRHGLRSFRGKFTHAVDDR